MATYHTVDGQPYSVTAGTAVTVTDSDGLVLSVKAGEQGVFVGNGGDATVTGTHHIVQVKGGFAVGGGGGGGGEGGGDVYKARDNVFTGANDFQGGLYMTRCTAMEPGKISRDSCGDLYWGTSKLNDQGGGDVYAAGCNVFTGTNRFRQGIYITDSSSMEPGKISRDSCGDLYWGCSKLNGQGGCGDVRSDGDNVFTGVNTFDSTTTFNGVAHFGDMLYPVNCGLYNYCGNLYWGCSKLNGGGDVSSDGCNVFTWCNTFSYNTYFNGITHFNSCTHLYGPATFYSAAHFSDQGRCLGEGLYNYNGNLYWGGCKLNGGGGGGGGDVYAAGDNVFTGMNSFNGTVGGSGVKDYADGYAEWSARTADLPSGTELSGVTYESGFMFGGATMPYHLTYTTDMLFSDGKAVRADRIRLRVMRGREAFAKPRHHYIVSGKVNNTTSISASDVLYKTVKPVSYYDTDWEEDGTKLVEFASAVTDPWWYPYYGNDVYYAVSNGTDPNDLTSVIKQPKQASSKPARGDVDWAALYSGYSVPSTGPVRAFMVPSSYRSQWSLSIFVEITGYKSTKTRIDDAAKKNEDNTFYGGNTFTRVGTFNNGVKLGDLVFTSDLECDTLNRVGHDLYWGSTKLNGGGGGGGGDVYADGDNVFTGMNTFNNNTSFNGGAYVNNCAFFYGIVGFNTEVNFNSCAHFCGPVNFDSEAYFNDQGDQLGYGLYNYNGDLYWGDTKLNGGGGGDVYSDGDNVFTGYNTFNYGVYFNGGATLYNCVSLYGRTCFNSCTFFTNGVSVRGRTCLNSCTYFNSCAYFNKFASFNDSGYLRGGSRLYNYRGDLYWGYTKLNDQGGGGGGDVYADGDNVFTGMNTFNNNTSFNCCANFGGPANFNGGAYFSSATFDCGANFNGVANFNSGAGFYDCGHQVGCDILYNYRGDLYWGYTKLNGGGGGGGGDVYKDKCNTFAGDNYFNKGLYLQCSEMACSKLSRDSNGDLYWGYTKLNGGGGGGGDVYSDGDNVFTGVNTFDSGANFSGCTSFNGDTRFNSATQFNSGTCFYGDTQFNGGTRFNGVDTYFYETPYLLCGLYLDGSYGFKLGLYDGHLHFRDARLDSALHNPATSGGTVEITIGQKSLVLDCSKLQRLIDLLEQQ